MNKIIIIILLSTILIFQGIFSIKQHFVIENQLDTIHGQIYENYFLKSELKDYDKYTEAFPSDSEQLKMRDYQLDIHMGSTDIYEGNRYVGTLKYDSTSALDSIIDEDNQ